MTIVLPAAFSSGDIIFLASATSKAKDTSVGGTSIFSKVPDMESLPPMDGRPYFICASKAPSSAVKGALHLVSSSVMRLKYSWNVKRIFFISPPDATIFAIESVTA